MECVKCGRRIYVSGMDSCRPDDSVCIVLAKKLASLCRRLKLTVPQLKELQDAANDVWNAIGADCLRAMQIPDTSGKGISRSVVIGFVLNADWSIISRKLSPEVKIAMDYHLLTYNRKAVCEALKLAFPDRTYGW